MSYTVPKGKSFVVGRRTYVEGETLPADVPEETLKAHGFTADTTTAHTADTETGTTSK